jgi:hypothetical protein
VPRRGRAESPTGWHGAAAEVLEDWMPTTEQRAGETSTAAQRAVVRFLADQLQAWHAAFPGLHRRAQPQIVTHLGTKGRDGVAVGELYGLVKQIFLLDDSTVKERILEIGRLEFCRLDPPEEPLSTRTVVVPTPALLDRFDGYLLTLAGRLLATATAIGAMVPPAPPPTLSAAQRSVILRALDCYTEPWRAALERIFDAQALSRARRVEAVRHLIATSHWALLHMAIEHHYGVSPFAEDDDSILADRMAAALLALTGQNFQTTRDHIGYLMEIGLLERRPGKALRVALAEPAALHFDTALAAAAAELPPLARSLVATADAPAEAAEPAELQTMRRPLAAPELRHYLAILTPEAAVRRVAVPPAGLTIGRLPPCDLVLAGGEVSRRHCRVEPAGPQLRITDLDSTNGTVVDGQRITQTVALPPGARVQVGAYVLTHECEAVAPAAPAGDGDSAEGTLRRPAGFGAIGTTAPGWPPRNKSGNSAG